MWSIKIYLIIFEAPVVVVITFVCVVNIVVVSKFFAIDHILLVVVNKSSYEAPGGYY